MAAIPAICESAVESLDDLLAGLCTMQTAPNRDIAPILPLMAAFRASTDAPGVVELMRLWNAMLKQRAAEEPRFSAVEAASMIEWFARLRRYLVGRLPESEQLQLARLPDDVAGMPLLTPVWVEEIRRRLSLFATTLPVAIDTSETTTLFAEHTFDEPIAMAESIDGQAVEEHFPEAPAFEERVVEERIVEEQAVEESAFGELIAEEPLVEEHAVKEHIGDAPAFAANTAALDVALSTPPMHEPAVAPAAIEHAHDEPAVASAPDDIWMSAEEVELIRRAISGELIALAQRWADAEDAATHAETLASIDYNGELIANVLDVMGLQHLSSGLQAMRTQVRSSTSDADGEHLLQWCVGLLGVLDKPGPDSALLLATVSEWLPSLDDDWFLGLVDELARVRMGMDPAQLRARKREASADDVSLQSAPDTLTVVLEGMLRELPGNTEKLGASVRAAVTSGDAADLDEARRVAHTLKGDANTVGIRGLAGLTHALEDILDVYTRHDGMPDPAVAELLVDSTDKIEEITDYLLGRGPHPDDLLPLYQRLLNAANAIVENDGVTIGDREPAPAAAFGSTSGSDATPEHAAPEHTTLEHATSEPTAQPAANAATRSLTLGSDVLDHLQSLVGESTIVAQSIDRMLENVVALRRDQEAATRQSQELLARLDDLVALRGAALQSTSMKEGAELDPLEIDQYNELHVISRQLAESQADSAVSMRTLRRTLTTLGDLRNEQQQVNRELQRSILRTRMVPFNQVSPRLQRIVRQTSKLVEKQVELAIIGEDTLIDAELLERVVEPIGHLIRNAIDHGLESSEQRSRAGKPVLSSLQIRVGVNGDHAIIDILDDGTGFDFPAIRARAVQMGLLGPQETADERRLTRFVLLPGFSTRDAATELSGRGVGLDVVNQRVLELRGSLQLNSRQGLGLEVGIRLPITQTLANVILVAGQRSRTAVVASSVQQIVGFSADACQYDEASQSISVLVDGKRIPALPIEVVYRESSDLNTWLGTGGLGLLMQNSSGEPTLVMVRSVEDVRSVVVKPVSPYLPAIPAVRGITQLPDGGLAPVVDMDVLLAFNADRSDAERSLQYVPSVPVPRVVVADDSLSARRSLEQLMRDAGYQVDVASDGFEAIAQVEAHPTAVLLLDMEMPRMNGLEVARNLRTKAASQDLPILMITSRTAEKHRQMAEQAGVTRMLSKPVGEDMLVAMVAEFIAAQAAKA